jgi:RNA polymerase sigma factor (sigma-70 family)
VSYSFIKRAGYVGDVYMELMNKNLAEQYGVKHYEKKNHDDIAEAFCRKLEIKESMSDNTQFVIPPKLIFDLLKKVKAERRNLSKRELLIIDDPIDEANAEEFSYKNPYAATPVYNRSDCDYCNPETYLFHPDEMMNAVHYKALVKIVKKHITQKEKRLIWLRFYEDMTYAEIAKEIGSSTSSVARRLPQILSKLRRILIKRNVIYLDCLPIKSTHYKYRDTCHAPTRYHRFKKAA